MYNYLVCGAGRQGTAVIYDLVEHCQAKQVVVHEPNSSARDKAKKHLVKIFGRGILIDQKIIFLDTYLEDDIVFDADVMISCAPYKANVELTKRAVRNRTNYCDLGGNPEVVAQQKAIVEREQKNGNGVVCAVVPECGLAPGLTNIMAAHLAQKGATDIQVRCGGLPEWEDFVSGDLDELNYRLVFSPEGLLSEYSGQVPILQDGELKFVNALDGHELIGVYECAYTSNNAPEVVETLQELGVQNYDYKTMRYPGHWAIAKNWRSMGFLHDDQSKNGPLLEALEKNKHTQWDGAKHKDVVLLMITGGKQDSLEETLWSYDLEIPYDLTLGFSAMESSTSWGITMVAHELAHWNIMSFGHHFWTPEVHINRELIIEGLNKRLLLLEDRNRSYNK